MPERLVVLPKLLEHQTDIALDDHRFKIVDAGRRFGKTLFGLVAVLDGHGPLVDGLPKYRGALHGATIWWVAPSFPVASKIWRDLKKALRKWGGDLQKNETEKRIEFPGGGSITVRSAHDPGGLVGDGLHGMVIDEASKCSEDTWSLYLRPTLADYEGWCVMISTPEGMNWFYEEWLLGAEHKDPDYASWKRTTADNPTISKAEVEKMRRRMGLYKFQRECLAEFVVSAGGLFQREWFKHYTLERRPGSDEKDREWLVPSGGDGAVRRDSFYIFVTCDFAWSARTAADYRVYAVWGRSVDGRLFLLHLERGQFEAPSLIPRLVKIVEFFGAKAVFVESSGPLVRLNAEARESLPGLVYEDAIHAGPEKKDKVTRAQPAAAAVEAGRVLFPKDAPWLSMFVGECCAFPDSGQHDDQVDCLTLAVRFSPPSAPSSWGPSRPTPDSPKWVGGRGTWLRKRDSW